MLLRDFGALGWVVTGALLSAACSRGSASSSSGVEVGEGSVAHLDLNRLQAPSDQNTKQVESRAGEPATTHRAAQHRAASNPPSPGALAESGAEGTIGGINAPNDGPAPTAKAPASSAPKVYAKSRFVWVYPDPSTRYDWIGYLWTGGQVDLKSTVPTEGRGCKGSWYAIEPRGYVCVDNRKATLDAEDPVVKFAREHAGDLDSPWPHQYAESVGTKAYERFPFMKVEAPLSVPQLPSSLYEPYAVMKPRSAIAYVREFEVGDDKWLLAADLRWIPASKTTPYAPSQFEGLVLDEKVKFPIAFFHKADTATYRRKEDGGFEAADPVWPKYAWVSLTNEQAREGKDTLVKVSGSSTWIREKDVRIPRLREATPWGARIGVADATGRAPRGRATWIEISVLGGWMIAYEGTKPVFTTLTSSGRGGTPVGKRPALETASTPTGDFPISGKFRTATMANDVVVHSAVPFAQNFNGPYALHAAYWHDDFGRLKSGGCVNVSPKDAHRLFEFTEPPVPEGWHGVRWIPKNEPATMVYVVD